MLNSVSHKASVIAAVALALAGCAKSTPSFDREAVLAEVNARENRFPDYPQPGTTYLSFSGAHGYQVNYLAPDGKARLWYPGNERGVPEEYKRDVISGQDAICWRHPSGSYNPVTKQSGGRFKCQSLALSQRLTVASLPGDPFSLETGDVPYRLDRCVAPTEFEFDRERFSC